MIRVFGTTSTKEKRKETARCLLAFAAFRAWGWEALPEFAAGERGKPFFPAFPQHHFNLSHAGEWVLCAISDEGAVGVDIEVIRPRSKNFPRYALSDAEYAAFDQSWEDFFRLWTLKEAYVKYQGGSIYPPASVPAPPPMPYRSYFGEGWCAALCAQGELPAAIEWIIPARPETTAFDA